jgi:hypothetical protein
MPRIEVRFRLHRARAARHVTSFRHAHGERARLLPRQGTLDRRRRRHRFLLRRQRRRPHRAGRGRRAARTEAHRAGVAARRGPVAGDVSGVAAAGALRQRDARHQHPRHRAVGPERAQRGCRCILLPRRVRDRPRPRLCERRLLPRRQDAEDAGRGARRLCRGRLPGGQDEGRAALAREEEARIARRAKRSGPICTSCSTPTTRGATCRPRCST